MGDVFNYPADVTQPWQAANQRALGWYKLEHDSKKHCITTIFKYRQKHNN